MGNCIHSEDQEILGLDSKKSVGQIKLRLDHHLQNWGDLVTPHTSTHIRRQG